MGTDAAASGAPAFSAPTHCPLYNASTPATLAAFILTEQSRAAIAAERHDPIWLASPAHRNQARTSSDRGPPALA